MRTFVMIKRDAIVRGLIGRIISRFEDADLDIINIRMCRKNGTWFAKMYGHLEGSVYRDMLEFMTMGPIIGISVSGARTVERVRKIVGVTDSVQSAIGTIRGDFGNGVALRYNCVHASDSEENADKEIEFFWDRRTDHV